MDDTALVHEFFDSLGEGRIDDWAALLSSDIAADTPFAPDGSPKRFEGLADVRHRFGDARERMQSLRFFDRVLHQTIGDGPIVATCASEGVRGDGQPYTNTYCWLFTVVDGHITHWVEYFDPQEVLRVRSA